jgi:hydroxymethylpyrimidine/phosphomethylpyrimidine kinase
MTTSLPVALTIAGSDCSAGAGIQADLKTFQHFGVHGLTAVTSVVSETANIVRAIHAVPVDVVIDQISLLLDSFPVGAIKTGMLVSAVHVEAVASLLAQHRHIPIVVDPVMIASTGSSLLEDAAIDSYRRLLLPIAHLITPNLPEAEKLLDIRSITTLAEMESAATQLSKRFGVAVLLKGGHLPGLDCPDILAEGEKIYRISAQRIATRASHGTGCTLSAAIVAGLARGSGLLDAAESAKDYLGKALGRSYELHHPPSAIIHALNQGTSFPQNEA